MTKHAENNQIIITIILSTIFYHMRLRLVTTTQLDKIGFRHQLIFLTIGHDQKISVFKKIQAIGDTNENEAHGKH